MISIGENNLFKSYFNSSSRISYWLLGAIALFLSASLYLAQDPLIGMIILLGVIALPIIWAFLYFPKLWVYTTTLACAVFLKTSGEGLSAADVLNGALIIGGLLTWFFYIVFIKKEPIVRNIADWLILFFYIAAIGSVVLSVVNGVDLIDALKEYFVFLITLLYFPIRYYIKDKREIAILFICLAAMIAIVDLFQFYGYYKLSTENLTYAYQLTRTVRTNQSIFTAGAIFGIVFYFYTTGFKTRLLLVAFSALTIGALISTFSRAFWMVLLLQIFILFFFLPIRKKIELSLLITIFSGFLLALAFLFMKDNTVLLLGALANRFTSTGKGSQDISVQSRLKEYEATFVKIRENPLGGNGFAKKFTFYNPITSRTFESSINHNGYIYLMYRLGIPMMIVYMIFLIYYFLLSIKYAVLLKDNFYKALAIGAAMSFMLMFIADSVASVLAYRDGILVIAFSVFATCAAEDFYRKNEEKTKSDVDKEVINS